MKKILPTVGFDQIRSEIRSGTYMYCVTEDLICLFRINYSHPPFLNQNFGNLIKRRSGRAQGHLW